jgi:uncharacterized membrane protein YhaH (DUF805 family)
MAVSVLPLLARTALALTALGVVVFCLHVRRLHDAEPSRAEFALLGAATVAVIAVGALTDDLALTSVADLAVLLGVTGPTVAAGAARG